MRGRRLAAAAATVLAGGCAAAAPPRAAAPAPAGRVVVLREAIGRGERYLGSPACGRCHERELLRWEGTAHARPLAGLPPGAAADPSCLRCHATGYGDPLGHGGAAAPPGLDSVGCEACHGPAAGHAESAHPALVPTLTGGDCPPCEANRICRACHTPERDPDFSLADGLAAVSCRGPAATRGPRAR